MALAQYRRKRDFRKTPEPRGAKRKKPGWLYVIQKHDASHLHYDFRLQIGETLKSWAVPKGPSLDPNVKRLAMHVEDHPIEYGSFEGTIPEGYGAGTVMLWDRGTWEPERDAHKDYRAGRLKFTLHGEKLRGIWMLIRSAGRADSGGKESWLLFKVRDDEARASCDQDILVEQPLSVASGRDLQEIAGNKKRSIWRSNRQSSRSTRPSTNGRQQRDNRQDDRRSVRDELKVMPHSRRMALPAKIAPQLATLVKEPPEGENWLSEIKFDGYRMICRIDHRKVKFSSRNQLDWTAKLDHLVKAVGGLGFRQAVLDGEVVALESDGTTSFQALQNAFRAGRSSDLLYYVFDLLYLDGVNLAKAPLEDRKRLLEKLIGDARGPIRYSEHVIGDAPKLFVRACKLHQEGIVCKMADQPYRPGRSGDWLKVKCLHRDEFVIGGYTLPSGSRQGFGALLLGYHDDRGGLSYSGRVGTGFSEQSLSDLSKRLKAIEQDKSPFENLEGRTGAARGAHWVKPTLVAQIGFSEWTRDGSLRHPTFEGLREDKPASQVFREKPVAMKSASKKSKVQPKSSNRGALRRNRTKRSGNSKPRSAPIELPASFRLTHPEKLLYPDDGITKKDLANYYAEVADWILPQLAHRPLVLVRCPEGAGKDCFFQKHAGTGTPEALHRVNVPEKNKLQEYVSVDNLDGLLSLVQLGVLEIHTWGSRADKLELPDRLIFDLDPDPSVAWSRTAESARQLRTFLEDLDLTSFLKTSGGKGVHLVVPIERRYEWDILKKFCSALADSAVSADSDRYTANMSKSKRKGKIYIDFLRNARGATAVAAYSTRARAGAPVSTPISWEELAEVESSSQFTLENVPVRLAELKRDPWQAIHTVRQSITKSLLKKFGL